jgi:DNA-directed RNA polymerase specialized sigma24 family protein
MLPYLYGVMRNKVLMQYRSEAIHLKYAIAAIGHEAGHEYPSSENIFLKKELETIVTNEIDKMPERSEPSTA